MALVKSTKAGLRKAAYFFVIRVAAKGAVGQGSIAVGYGPCKVHKIVAIGYQFVQPCIGTHQQVKCFNLAG